MKLIACRACGVTCGAINSEAERIVIAVEHILLSLCLFWQVVMRVRLHPGKNRVEQTEITTINQMVILKSFFDHEKKFPSSLHHL